MKRRQVIKDALKDLGYFKFKHISGWGSPYVTIDEKILTICDYLGIEIKRRDEVIAVRKKKSGK